MHTPGPWMIEADPCHYDTLSTVVGGESQQRKSRIWRQVHVEVGGFAEVAEQEANARLISAAPDLAEALEAVTTAYAAARETWGCGDCAELRAARAALSKAGGLAGAPHD